MSLSVPVPVMDKILDEIATSTKMTIVSDVATPTGLNNVLASVTMTPEDFTKANGSAGAGSRKLTIVAKYAQPVTVTGVPRHVVLSKDGVIKLVTTATGPDLTQGSKVDLPSWIYELGIPSAS